MPDLGCLCHHTSSSSQSALAHACPAYMKSLKRSQSCRHRTVYWAWSNSIQAYNFSGVCLKQPPSASFRLERITNHWSCSPKPYNLKMFDVPEGITLCCCPHMLGCVFDWKAMLILAIPVNNSTTILLPFIQKMLRPHEQLRNLVHVRSMFWCVWLLFEQ